MRCSCQRCGTYMIQDERGEESRCVCPQCFFTCSACMGTGIRPLDRDSLRAEMLRRDMLSSSERAEEDAYGEPDDPYSP